MVNNLILSGGIFHNFDETSLALSELMSSFGVSSQIFSDIDQGISALASGEYQMLTVNALRWQMSGEKYDPYREQWGYSPSSEGRQVISSFVENGNSLLGIHTASICFDDWPQWKEILGGAWHWGNSYHPPLGDVSVEAIGADIITEGCRGFKLVDEVYSDLDVMPNIQPLLSSVDPISGQPVMWKHKYGRGRVAYDALCHDGSSLQEPNHRLVLQRAIQWLLEGELNNEKH